MILYQKEINGKQFLLVRNSIIEEPVEAIVNPANQHLAHGGGVAGLISRAGGPTVQQESNRKAPVMTGKATYTGAGTLPFKYIIHTVGPIYRGGTQNEPKLLHAALKVHKQVKTFHTAVGTALDFHRNNATAHSGYIINFGITGFGFPMPIK